MFDTECDGASPFRSQRRDFELALGGGRPEPRALPAVQGHSVSLRRGTLQDHAGLSFGDERCDRRSFQRLGRIRCVHGRNGAQDVLRETLPEWECTAPPPTFPHHSEIYQVG